jgi:peptidoglycan/xylan/chitin deacetylase (PgdA/CDA1 family)
MVARVKVFGEGNSSIVFSRSREPTKKIALTFDDGPHPRYTERILEILDRYDIKATFFVIGVNIQNYPEPFAKVVAAGHEIGNHSFSHGVCGIREYADIAEEMQKCDSLIYDITGKKPSLYRPPCGIYDLDVVNTAKKEGHSIILWSVDTLDWKNTPSEDIKRNVSQNVKGGDIILMHDYTSGRNTTCDALELMIPELLSAGYEFVTVSELIKQS